MSDYDVAVIGGGPAGLSAAAAAAGSGARTVLFDENRGCGGQLRYRAVNVTYDGAAVSATELAHTLAETARRAGATLAPASVVWGIYPGFALTVSGPAVSGVVSAGRVVIASGETDLAVAFPGSDLPGVMTGSGLLRMLHLHRVWPGGKRVALVGDDAAMADEVAGAIERAGGAVTARIAGRPIVHERGGVVAGIQAGHDVSVIDTDLVAICAGTQPDIAPALMLECETGYCEALGGFVPQRSVSQEMSVPGTFVCGGAAGRGAVEAHIAEGELAGIAAAASLGLTSDDDLNRAIDALAALDPKRATAAGQVRASWTQHAVEAVRARGVER
ncbi:MAG: FAD-dependent oxidoreductase [Thermomicrobiales bacterium]|nr:FAD-dependent oxidoreductase [Thermomicrobiales bacterium]